MELGTNKESETVITKLGEARLSQPAQGQLVDAKEAAFAAANACESKKAKSTLVLDVSKVTLLADYFVICGAESAAQVRAIVDAVDDALSNGGCKPKSIEGKSEGRWVLLDFGHVIVHVLQEKERSYYKIEQFWNQGLIVDREDWVED